MVPNLVFLIPLKIQETRFGYINFNTKALEPSRLCAFLLCGFRAISGQIPFDGPLNQIAAGNPLHLAPRIQRFNEMRLDFGAQVFSVWLAFFCHFSPLVS